MADPRSIHEFLTGEVEATTLLLGDFVDLDAQSGYTTYKMSVSDIGEVILEDIEYTQDLQTVDKTIIGAINENKSIIGYSYDAYDPTTAYSKDDLCIYNNSLYKAKQATTGNLPTNTTYWEQTSIADEIGRIDTAIGWTELSESDFFEDPTPNPDYVFSFRAYKQGKLIVVPRFGLGGVPSSASANVECATVKSQYIPKDTSRLTAFDGNKAIPILLTADTKKIVLPQGATSATSNLWISAFSYYIGD